MLSSGCASKFENVGLGGISKPNDKEKCFKKLHSGKFKKLYLSSMKKP
jgi:hypothetical protein